MHSYQSVLVQEVGNGRTWTYHPLPHTHTQHLKTDRIRISVSHYYISSFGACRYYMLSLLSSSNTPVFVWRRRAAVWPDCFEIELHRFRSSPSHPFSMKGRPIMFVNKEKVGRSRHADGERWKSVSISRMGFHDSPPITYISVSPRLAKRSSSMRTRNKRFRIPSAWYECLLMTLNFMLGPLRLIYNNPQCTVGRYLLARTYIWHVGHQHIRFYTNYLQLNHLDKAVNQPRNNRLKPSSHNVSPPIFQLQRFRRTQPKRSWIQPSRPHRIPDPNLWSRFIKHSSYHLLT